MSIDKISQIFEKAALENRKALNEYEVYEIFSILGLPLPEYLYQSANGFRAEEFASLVFEKIKTEKIVLKIVSHKTLHKTETGGVKILFRDKSAIEKATREFISSFDSLDGLLACAFLEHSPFALGEELLLGARKDDAFGPILTIGPGGTNSEGLAKALNRESGIKVDAIENIFNRKSHEDFLSASWILNYCFGKVRGSKKIVDIGELIRWTEAFSYLMKNFNDYCGSKWAIDEIEVNPLCAYKGRFYALDGVLRFSKASGKKRIPPTMNALTSIIKPKTVGVVGVSEKKMNMARIILNNVAKAGFPKEKIYVIKDSVEEIDGIKCYKNLAQVPEKIDLYVVAVPSEQVPQVLLDASESAKVNGVVLISGGMGEKSGSENIAEKVNSLIFSAREKNPDFALSGGNSLGIVLNESKVNTLFIPEYKMEHPLGSNIHMSPTAFVSQSGAFVISALSKMTKLKPLYSITVGNQQDVTVVDYASRLVSENIKNLLIYIEGFKYLDGLNFLRVIEKARASGINVLVYKAGRTSVGQKAVMGHTASIAGDYPVTRALMEKAGALVCEDFDEFCDLTFLFSYFGDLKIKNRNVFFISNAGFESAGMADSISKSNAVVLNKDVEEKMRKTLKNHKLDSIVDVKNPMDVTPMCSDAALEELISAALSCDDIGSAVISMVPLTAAMHTLPKSDKWPDDMENKSFLKKLSLINYPKKPVIFCVASGDLYNSYCDLAIAEGFVVFRSSDRAVRMLEKFMDYSISH